jgi:hypothetical protein
MPNTPVLTFLLTTLEAGATLAFALSGLLEAARKRLDPVGVCMVAGLAAFGGGTLRDVVPSAITDPMRCAPLQGVGCWWVPSGWGWPTARACCWAC